MRAVVPALLMGSLIFVMILYLGAFQPQLIEQAQRRVGLLPPLQDGQAQALQAERERLDTIDDLLIPEKNKDDLRQGRPYWGAPQAMTALAMGRPPDNGFVKMHNEVLHEFQNYFFSGPRGLLTFEFQNNALACVHYLRERRSVCNRNTASLYADRFPYAEAIAQYTSRQESQQPR